MINFDGVNGYVDLSAHKVSFTGLSQGTIVAWIKTSQITPDATIFDLSDIADTDSFSSFWLSGGRLNFGVWENNAALLGVQSTAIVADNTLHHVAVTVDSSGNKLYIDGAQATVTYSTGNATTRRFNSDVTGVDIVYIGGDRNSGGLRSMFTGLISDVREYSRALSANEIATIYAAKGHDGIVSGLVARYPMLYDPPGTIYQQSPNVSSVTTTAFPGDSTTHNVAMPASVTAGNLLITHICIRNGASFTTPTGWTPLWSTTNSTSTHAAFAKIADGTEGGTTVDFSTSGSDSGAAQVYRITDWYGTLAGVEVGTPATGSNTAPNPPALTPSWGSTSAFTLWLVLSGASDDDSAYTGAPGSFTDLTSTVSGAGANSGAEVGSARRVAALASLDPGNFALAASQLWVVNTVAVRPSEVIIEVSDSSLSGAVGGTPDAQESVLSKRRRFR